MSQPRAFVSRMMHPDAIALIGESAEMEVWPDDPPPSAEELRAKLSAVFDEFEVTAQVTGLGSLFGIHFTSEDIRDYRSVVRSDQTMRKALFTGLLNEGILLQTGAAGAMNSLTATGDIDSLVDATRRVVERVR